jgi:hypothetical protein
LDYHPHNPNNPGLTLELLFTLISSPRFLLTV